jgi:hypothetical protein
MKEAVETTMEYRRWLSEGVVRDDVLWYVDWNFTYLCAFDLLKEKVTEVVKLPECEMVVRLAYRSIVEYGENKLLIVPFDIDNKNVLIFDVETKEFEILNPCEQGVVSEQLKIRFLSVIMHNNTAIFSGYTMEESVYTPMMLGLNLSEKNFFIEEDWKSLFEKYHGKGGNFGFWKCQYRNHYVLKLENQNVMIFYDLNTRQIHDVTFPSMDIIGQYFVYQNKLYLSDKGERIVSLNEDGSLQEEKGWEKNFQDDFFACPFGKGVVFTKLSEPILEVGDGEAYHTIDFRIDKPYRELTTYPPVIFPVARWNDVLLLFSYYDSKLYMLDEQMTIIKGMEIKTDFALQTEEVLREIKQYMRRDSVQGYTYEGWFSELNLESFINHICEVR